MNPSAKAAQQIAEKCRNEVRLAIDVALQTRPEGPVDGWEKFLEHPMKQFDAIIQQALSDSLQPYRELAIENNALQSRVAELEKERDKYKESLESIERDTNIYSSFSHEVAREALSPEGEPK